MQIAFIIGTGRCGSTLLHEVFAKHRDTAFVAQIEEAHPRLALLRRYSNAVYRMEQRKAFARLGIGKKFSPTEAYSLVDHNISSVYSRPFRDLSSEDVTPWLCKQFREFFGSRSVETPKTTHLLHKYTGWSRIGFFGSIFPEARFVHVIRDGRAVANSWLQMPWWNGYEGTANWLWGPLEPDQQVRWEASGRSFPVLAALGWEKLVRSYDVARDFIASDRYLEVRYEWFLDDPVETSKEILDFLQLDWNSDFARQLSSFDIRTSRRAAYRTELSTSQLRAVEVAIGDCLIGHGYSTESAL